MKNRSLFFPLALIATGVIWLLISMGRIPAENVWALAHFWPFLLIGAGVGLMLRGWWSPAQWIIDVVVVGAAVVAIVLAPQLGWNHPQWGFGWGFDSDFSGSIPGSRNIVSQTHEVSDFRAIEISYPVDVLVKQGKSESVTIEADDNLLPQLQSRVSGGTLYIENTERDWGRRVRPSRTVKVTIIVKDLREVDFSGAGSIRIENLETDQLTVNVSGAGDLKLDNLTARKLECHLSGVGSVTANGAVDELRLDISGVGNFKSSKLLSKSAEVHVSGTGSATVHVADELRADISGTGSVSYYGSPKISQSVSGLGSVRKAGE